MQGGSLFYRIDGKKAAIQGFQGTAVSVQVPGTLEGAPVTLIEKKAFLSDKELPRIVLPEAIEELGDWAFAYCDGLRQVVFPQKKLRFGKNVFWECGSLEQVGCGDGRTPDEMLAAAVGALDAYYLLDLQEAGTDEWFRKWDARLLDFMRTSDQEGYSRQVLCGEEDYGSTDLEAYVSGRRRKKVKLAFLRCLHPEGISREWEMRLEEYLRAHTKGGESEETWLTLQEEYGENRDYYSLFARSGCITRDNLDCILRDLGDSHPEMKAFFLRYGDENFQKEDFWSGLEL